MASNKKIVRNSAFGVLGIGALALGIVAWVWLPATGAKLDQQKQHLQSRISTLEGHVADWHNSAEGDLDDVTNNLPTASALPGWAGEVLADISKAGAMELGYVLGDGITANGTARRQVEVTFMADVATMGNILDRVTLWRPGIAVETVRLIKGEAGRIQATLNLTLLGKSDA